MRPQKNYIISPICAQQQSAKKLLFSTHSSYLPNSAIIFSQSTLNSRSKQYPFQFIRLILSGNNTPIYKKQHQTKPETASWMLCRNFLQRICRNIPKSKECAPGIWDVSSYKSGIPSVCVALIFSRRAHLLTTCKRAVVSLPLVGIVRSCGGLSSSASGSSHAACACFIFQAETILPVKLAGSFRRNGAAVGRNHPSDNFLPSFEKEAKPAAG